MEQEYVPPGLEDLGSVHEVTLGQAAGSRLDADFTAGTLTSNITFS